VLLYTINHILFQKELFVVLFLGPILLLLISNPAKKIVAGTFKISNTVLGWCSHCECYGNSSTLWV